MKATTQEEFAAGVQLLAQRLEEERLLTQDVFFVWARAWGLAHGHGEDFRVWPAPAWGPFREACRRLRQDQVTSKTEKQEGKP